MSTGTVATRGRLVSECALHPHCSLHHPISRPSSGPGPKVNSDITSDTPVDAHAKGAGAANAAAAAGRASSAAGGKVQVDFYGESLCPDCQVRRRSVGRLAGCLAGRMMKVVHALRRIEPAPARPHRGARRYRQRAPTASRPCPSSWGGGLYLRPGPGTAPRRHPAAAAPCPTRFLPTWPVPPTMPHLPCPTRPASRTPPHLTHPAPTCPAGSTWFATCWPPCSPTGRPP